MPIAVQLRALLPSQAPPAPSGPWPVAAPRPRPCRLSRRRPVPGRACELENPTRPQLENSPRFSGLFKIFKEKKRFAAAIFSTSPPAAAGRCVREAPYASSPPAAAVRGQSIAHAHTARAAPGILGIQPEPNPNPTRILPEFKAAIFRPIAPNCVPLRK